MYGRHTLTTPGRPTAACPVKHYPEVLKTLESAQTYTPSDHALRNAVSSNSINKMALDLRHASSAPDTYFSLETKNSGISDQQSSGRCWLFTGLNVLRHQAMEKLGTSNFFFSQIYCFFYDQLEKSNLFLQGIIDTRKLSIDDRRLPWNGVRMLFDVKK